MRFVKYKAISGEWYANIVGDNGEVLFRTSEGYKDKRDCDHAIELVKTGAVDAEVREA